MSNKKTMAIIASAVVVTIGIGFGATNIFLKKDAPPVFTEENYQQIIDDMEQEVDDGYFETYMNVEWIFPEGDKASSNAILGNSPNNSKPIRCVVTLDTTGEVIMETGVLPVGTEMPSVILNKDLEAGNYDATCTIYLLDKTEDGNYTEYSNAGFKITLTVEK